MNKDQIITVNRDVLVKAIHQELVEFFSWTEAEGSIKHLGELLIQGGIDSALNQNKEPAP